MIVFESVSLFINLFIIALLLMKIGRIKGVIPERFIIIIFWVLIVVFSLNTIGNLFAENIWERAIGTPLTLIIAFLLWIIVRNPATARK